MLRGRRELLRNIDIKIEKYLAFVPQLQWIRHYHSTNMDRVQYAGWMKALHRFYEYPALLLLLSSVLINLIACYGILDHASTERRYLGVAWVAALCLSIPWCFCMCLPREKCRLVVSFVWSILGTALGWGLGIAGAMLLDRSETEANEEAALVLMNIPIQFVIGLAELSSSCIYAKRLYYYDGSEYGRVHSFQPERNDPQDQQARGDIPAIEEARHENPNLPEEELDAPENSSDLMPDLEPQQVELEDPQDDEERAQPYNDGVHMIGNWQFDLHRVPGEVHLPQD